LSRVISTAAALADCGLGCDAEDAGDAGDAGDGEAAGEEPHAQTRETSQIATRPRRGANRGANCTSGLYHGDPPSLWRAVSVGLPLVAARELSVPCTTSS